MLLKLCLVVLCVIDVDALMTSREFHRLVAPACFKHGAEDKDVLPRNIKTFIELVDKVEKLHQLDDAADTASLLLRRFSMPYIRLKKTDNGYMFLVDKHEEARATIFEVILRSVPRIAFKEGAFTSHEKCALFFMLSHSIEHEKDSAGVLAYVENGVVSPFIYPEEGSALSLSAMLKGISASKYASRESTAALLAILRPYSGIVPEGHTVVDHLYGPTLAGLLGTSVLWRNTSVVPQIGRNGLWTSPLCPKEFKLSSKLSDITDAEISGTIDGFILNVITSRISKQRQHPFSLSKLMSTYYSSRGIRELIPEFSNGVSFCNRDKVFHKLFSTERLTEQTLAVARLFNSAEALPLKEVIGTYAILPAVKKFAQKLEHFVTSLAPTCQEIQRLGEKGTCQTQSNVLLLLDPVSGSPEFDNYQRKLSAYLSEKLLENNPSSRVSISSSSLADNPHVLKLLFSSSYRQKNPSCQISRPDRGCVDCKETDIWRAVNGTWSSLLQDDVEMAAGTVTPSKVVIYFKFNDFKSNEEDLQNVIRGLRKSHEDLYILVVGPKPEIVEKFRADVKDAIVIIPQAADQRVMQRIASELAYEICMAPAIVHCRNCLTSHLQASSSHRTVLAPHSSYSWAVHPDELNRRPSLVNFTVSSESLPLKICYERQNSTHQRVPIEETNCHETSPKREFIKSFTDLCGDTNCDMVYFKVAALARKPGVPFIECNHSECSFPDETRVEINYVAEFEDDLLRTSNRLDSFHYPAKVYDNSKNNAKLQKQNLSSLQDRYSLELNDFSLKADEKLQDDRAHPSRSISEKRFSGYREQPPPDRGCATGQITKCSTKSFKNEFEKDYTQFEEGEHRAQQKDRSETDVPFDKFQRPLKFINSRPDVPYEEAANFHHQEVFYKQNDEHTSSRKPLKTETENAREDFNQPPHGSFRLNGGPVRNDNLEGALWKLTRNNFEKSETLKSYREQSTREGIVKPLVLNYPDVPITFEETLRPTKMAEVCAISKQKNFLLTLDQFLYILEKLEEANPSITIVQLAQFLLDEYSLDSPTRANISAVQIDVFRSVQRALIGAPLSGEDVSVNDDVLLPSEKCHLYHLLSYAKERLTESGVVALDFDEDIAISLGPVIRGVLGSPSLVAESFRSVRQMANSLNHVAEVKQDPDSRITILNALTFGVIMLPEIIANPRADLVDSANSWQDTFCPYDFVRRPTFRDEVDSRITYSRVRGAIDGYIIGLHSNISASSSLRALLHGYYSIRGVARAFSEHDPSTELNRLSVCRRYDLFPSDILTGTFEREFISFYRAFASAYPGLVTGLTESSVMDAAARILKKIMRATEHKLLSMPSFCDDGAAVSLANPTIETPAEIHLILKTDDTRFMPLEEMRRYWAHQKSFVSFLSRQLNLGPDRKVFLQMNQQSIQDGHLLQIGVKNPGLPSSVACQTQKTFKAEKMGDFSPQNEATVLEALHQKLLNTSYAGKINPSRIVVWMAHGSEQRSPAETIRRAVENLKKDFGDKVAFFAVTTTQTSHFGKNLFSVKFWDESTNKGALAVRNRARDLARESFLAPAMPTCLNCGKGPIRIKFEEKISETGVKVYKFTLEEFPQMSKGYVTLKSLNGILMICYGRNDALTINGWNRCTEIADKVISFRPNCKGTNDCEPIYLAVFGIREACESRSCTGKIEYILEYDEQPRSRRQSGKSLS